MKAVIYNIFKLGYDGIAYSICCGVLFSFFLPIKHFLIFTIFVVFADTITGIKAARKEGKAITSKGLYRTTEKIVVYFTSILTLFPSESSKLGLFVVVRSIFKKPISIEGRVAFAMAVRAASTALIVSSSRSSS